MKSCFVRFLAVGMTIAFSTAVTTLSGQVIGQSKTKGTKSGEPTAVVEGHVGVVS
ncbi:MAG: hypothetical protein SOZ00_02480 [Tidjanibacter sp.]|nr:hypothetical protein [Tidjanibacter sp.]